MSLFKAAAIVGVGDVELVDGKVAEGLSVLEIQALAAKRALDDAGLTLNDVDGLFVAGLWSQLGAGVFPTLSVAEYLGIQPSYSDSTQIGGSSPLAHIGHAAAAIKAGLCEVALILYGSTQRSDRSRTLGGKPAELNLQYETPWGLPVPVGAYALAATRHMYQYGTTSEQLAEIAVATRKWAQLNPQAMMRAPLTIEDVLASPLICEPLHRLDCCLVTDGAGAIVLTSPSRAKDCRKKPIWLLGHGEAHTHYSIHSMPDLTLMPAYYSGKRAFEMAGVTHDDIDVAEIYDSFTITVLLTLEALGFCEAGEGGAFVSNQRTAPGGDFPMNTNGGGLSYAHPGMYGTFLVIEAVRQLRGECGERQVPNARIALASGTGVQLSSSATCILARD